MMESPAHTIEKLQTLKLYGMADAFRTQLETTNMGQLSFEERFAMLVDQQWLWKENRALARRLRSAKLKERGYRRHRLSASARTRQKTHAYSVDQRMGATDP
jgi:hypothetical protein